MTDPRAQQLDMFPAQAGRLPGPGEAWTPDQWFTHSRPMVRIAECANAIGCSEQHIRNLIDCGKLEAHAINTADDPKQQHLRIYRASFMRYINPQIQEPPQ